MIDTNKLTLTCLFFFIVSSNSLYSQTTNTRDQYNFNDSSSVENIVVGTQNNYYGLDSSQLKELKSLNQNSADLLKEMIKLTEMMARDRTYTDSVLNVSMKYQAQQTRIDELKRINDSIMNSGDIDSLMYKKLEARYEILLNENLRSFWEKNPDFDPFDNYALVRLIEKSRKLQFANLWEFSCPHAMEIMRCNSCIRKYPECWIGIISGGNYYFSATGTNSLGSNGKNINQLQFKLKDMGLISVGNLRAYYQNYSTLIRMKDRTLDEQYNRFKQNPELNLEEIINPKNKCTSGFGNLVVQNRLDEKLTIWLCTSSNCSYNNYLYKIDIVSGGKGTFYNIPQGFYSYGSQRGASLVYDHLSGQTSVESCKDGVLTID